MSTPKKQVIRVMHGALEKKIFFAVKCAHFTFLKSIDLKKASIFTVKCAHLVPEPGSRWRSHMVPGSKKKNLRRNFNAEMHRQVHHTDVIPELAGR